MAVISWLKIYFLANENKTLHHEIKKKIEVEYPPLIPNTGYEKGKAREYFRRTDMNVLYNA